MRNESLTYSARAGWQEDTTILTLRGPLIYSSLLEVRQYLSQTRPQVMIVDLAETPYLDSAGLGVIMMYYAAAARSGRVLLLAGANDRVHALLGLARVSPLLQLYPTVEAAEASL